MEQPDWMARVSTTIANEVRRIRQERGMSAQNLSDRCAELGAPIPRTVLSNLENGRRGNVTVAEMLVLAAALDVPPATLAFPVGYVDAVESLPGVKRTPLEAVEWVSGQADSGVESGLDWKAVALKRFRDHERMMKDLETMLEHMSWVNLTEKKRDLETAKIRVAAYAEQASEAAHQALMLGERAREAKGDTDEGRALLESLSHLNEQAFRLQMQVEDAKTVERRAVDAMTVATSTAAQVRHQIERLRDDREDMVSRGWIPPELPVVLQKALEEEDPLARYMEG